MIQTKSKRVVPHDPPHTIYRGDYMEGQKSYDATYKFGKTTVHIVAPKPMSNEKKEKIIHDMHMAGWTIVDEIIERNDPNQIIEIFGPDCELLKNSS